MSESVLYRHFVRKKQLFLEVFHFYGQHFVHQWFIQTLQAFAQQPRPVLARLFMSYRQLAQEDAALQQLVVLAFAEVHDPDMTQAAGAYQHTLFSLLTQPFESAGRNPVSSALSDAGGLQCSSLRCSREPLSLTDAQLLALGCLNLSEEASSTFM